MVPTLCNSLPVPPQDVIPTLRDLSLLSVPNWYLLGLQLGVGGDDLDVIERNYPRDNHMCKVKMFGAWLRMDTSATYRKLARALVTVGKRNIAEAMCTARGTKVTILECSFVYYSACGYSSCGRSYFVAISMPCCRSNCHGRFKFIIPK